MFEWLERQVVGAADWTGRQAMGAANAVGNAVSSVYDEVRMVGGFIVNNPGQAAQAAGEGFRDGSVMLLNNLTFGMNEDLSKESQRLRAENGGLYTVANNLFRAGTVAFYGAAALAAPTVISSMGQSALAAGRTIATNLPTIGSTIFETITGISPQNLITAAGSASLIAPRAANVLAVNAQRLNQFVQRIQIQPPRGLYSGTPLPRLSLAPATGGEWVRPPGWRLPKNGTWEGTPGHSNFKPTNPAELGLKPGEVVPFRNGRPDFSNWSKGNFTSKEALTGVHKLDEPIMLRTIAEQKGWTQQQVKDWLKSEKLSPHHAGGNDIQLIPWELHGNPSAVPPLNGIRHMGGAFDLRNPG